MLRRKPSVVLVAVLVVGLGLAGLLIAFSDPSPLDGRSASSQPPTLPTAPVAVPNVKVASGYKVVTVGWDGSNAVRDQVFRRVEVSVGGTVTKSTKKRGTLTVGVPTGEKVPVMVRVVSRGDTGPWSTPVFAKAWPQPRWKVRFNETTASNGATWTSWQFKLKHFEPGKTVTCGPLQSAPEYAEVFGIGKDGRVAWTESVDGDRQKTKSAWAGSAGDASASTHKADYYCRPGGPPVAHVIAVSVDGLNPEALDLIGLANLPGFSRLEAEGAFTRNARTEVEMTITLPNHTGMITGRPVRRRFDGHGVTVNKPTAETVQHFAGEPVESIFSVLNDHGDPTALFASKPKFDLWPRSWQGIDYTYIHDNAALTAQAIAAIPEHAFTFLHLSGPDDSGHANGWLSRPYLDAIRRADTNLLRLIEAIEESPSVANSTVLLVTADHGGGGTGHSDPTTLANYRIGFWAWGTGVPTADLYELNPEFDDPGIAQPTYKDAEPIRNGNLANLALSLLDRGGVPGSMFDADQTLVVQGP